MRIEGMEGFDERALLTCLATHERKRVSLGLSALREPTCGKSPFGPPRHSLTLFAFPWQEWPVYEEAVFRLDLERIERWYAARGYYGAHIVEVSSSPAALNERPTCEGDDCTVELTIHVEQGVPVRVRHVVLEGVEALDPDLQAALRTLLDPVKTGSAFDEAVYEGVKQELGRRLRESGYARATVVGDAAVHRGLMWADLTIRIEPRLMCKVGDVRVLSPTAVPTRPILDAAKLRRGGLYRESDLEDAQRSVYALGAFSAVTVRGELEGKGDQVDVVIQVEPRRESEIVLGAGVMSGVLTTGPAAEEWVSVPQWDVHLIGRYEHRNFLGGLRHLSIEERPRLLMLGPFPTVPGDSPRFGNNLYVTFAQPSVIEARTRLVADARWDYGPDPFLLFFRHDVGVSLGLERGFLRQRLSARIALHQDIFEVPRRQPLYAGEDLPSGYRLPFVEERVSFDLRDDAANPTRGAYLRVSVHEAVRVWEPSWNYIRVLPEARGYVPVGLGMVLAGRAAFGSLHILDASPELDETSKKLGPQAYRLRGGGAQSNRGFGPGQLGDGLLGGIRRWEGTLELRVPLSADFSIAGFSDVGDVHAGPSFRFSHLNTAVGAGLRYRTIVGPIRFDVGVRVPKAQRADGSPAEPAPRMNLGFTKFAGAVHLTIGESF